ncbi:MAG: radical SAM protein [Candidatus Omnitrophica bacterium]|nr:radical SAM protein [Candidatus Omnitrophota bacterium]
MSSPALIVADKKQKILEMPGFYPCAQGGGKISLAACEDMIPLPRGSKLFFLPERYPIGFNIRKRSYEGLQNFLPVAVFLPPGYTGLFYPAYKEKNGARILPLFSYSMVAYYKGAYYVPAVKVDLRKNHDMSSVDWKELRRKVQMFKNTKNRLIKHLADCALINFCPNAVNFFLGKYECPLPVSLYCNARCIGCISFQPQGSCPATQPRLRFVPAAEEIAEIAIMHIRAASNPVVSFGQGCEGEPLLKADIIRESIRLIRKKTSRGTIHMNTNASLTEQVQALCEAGLDSMRVSLNSVREEFYRRYYLPRGYSFADVCNSIAAAKRYKKFVSLNYLVMPGFTDREDEFDELVRFVKNTRIDMIQWRNLNYDPLRYFKRLKVCDNSSLLGIRSVIQRLGDKFPELQYGYFNMPKEKFFKNCKIT